MDLHPVGFSQTIPEEIVRTSLFKESFKENRAPRGVFLVESEVRGLEMVSGSFPWSTGSDVDYFGSHCFGQQLNFFNARTIRGFH